MTRGPPGVSLISVWKQPVHTSSAANADVAVSSTAAVWSGSRALGRNNPVSRNGSAGCNRPVTARWHGALPPARLSTDT